MLEYKSILENEISIYCNPQTNWSGCGRYLARDGKVRILICRLATRYPSPSRTLKGPISSKEHWLTQGHN